MVQMEKDDVGGRPDDPREYLVFLLRLWRQEGGWRGRLMDLASGEACNFAGWQELIAALLGSDAHSQLGLCAQEDPDVHPES